MSTRYPQLWLPALKVRFRDGVAEVDDPATAAALTGIRTEGVALAPGETLPGAGDPGDDDGGEQGDGAREAEGEQPAAASDAPAPGDGAPEEQPAAEKNQPLAEPPAISEPKPRHVDYAADVLGLDRTEMQPLTKADIAERIRTELAKRAG
ncbi:hypothetical protein [Streptomonospora wellingtoniae]|uniref:Uncharacterized protein n=1 Tax=Streptomonospora wellingtoniae TaxID=3075544 RepID=A0ABU2L0I9_9ACTN|nr:hypothetical protein [Streptomonospora sp. DSM 45055]MDT0305069.1 hypothetical protein [Streptomonospora sp. DSM 45055]